MDGLEQSLAYSKADFADVNAAFVNRWRSLFPEVVSGILLDLGCGPADIPIRLCRALPEIAVTAVDASEAMIDVAELDIADAGLTSRVDLIVTRLPDPNLPRAFFDGVVSNSLLHHLENPRDLWEAIRIATKPGAPFLIVDLFRPATENAARAIVDAYSASEPEILRRDFYHSLLAAYTVDEVRTQLDGAGLNGASCESITDRHWAVWGRVP